MHWKVFVGAGNARDFKNPSSNETFGRISATEMARDELLVDVFLDKELFQYFLGFIVNVFHVGT